MRLSLSSASLAALSATLLAAAHASADFDVSPAIGAGSKIVTNAFEDDTGSLVNNVRVFGYEFGEIPGPANMYFASDPGFHPQPDTSGFAANSTLGLRLTSTLKFWSGTGSPTFANESTGASLRIGLPGSSSTFIVSTGISTPATVLTIDPPIDASGETDAHVDSNLFASGATYTAPGTPPTGIYLATLSVSSSTAGVVPSDATYILYNNGAEDDALDDALTYVRDNFAPGSNLASASPEPATAALAVGAAGFIVRRRRAARMK